VLAHDSDYMRIVPRTPPPAAALDQRGTRRAPRFKMPPNVSAEVEGRAAMLIDISTVGAQVVGPVALKPDQRITVALSDEGGSVRFAAIVVWTSFEIPPGGTARFRAGLDFGETGADAAAIAAYCERRRIKN